MKRVSLATALVLSIAFALSVNTATAGCWVVDPDCTACDPKDKNCYYNAGECKTWASTKECNGVKEKKHPEKNNKSKK